MRTSKLALGTVQFGLAYGISNETGQTSEREVASILACARQNGIQVIDTAAGYGTAEEVLGKNDLTSFSVVSKFLSPGSISEMQAQLRRSLAQLRVPKLYGYLSHRPQDLMASDWQWQELKKMKAEGYVQKIGYSLNHPDELAQLLAKGYAPDLIQVPFNYLDKRFESGIKKVKDHGCEVHTRSAFLQGLFFREPDSLPSHFDAAKRLLYEVRSPGNVAGRLLRFVVDQSFIDKVVVGVENANQLMMNIEDLNKHQEPLGPGHTLPDTIVMPSLWPKETR